MNVTERIQRLRSLMAEKGIDAYVVPTAPERVCRGTF